MKRAILAIALLFGVAGLALAQGGPPGSLLARNNLSELACPTCAVVNLGLGPSTAQTWATVTAQNFGLQPGATGPLFGGSTGTTIGGTDLSGWTFTSFSDRRPFQEDVPLQASNMNTSARLTSDGAAPSATNTLNLPLNSMNLVHCTLGAQSSLPLSGVSWTIDFSVLVGATASTAAIVGDPAWVSNAASGTNASAITLGAPLADTTLGAVNITATATAGTWNLGGSCRVISTQRVL